MYNGMGIVRAIPGPVFSIATFAGGLALKIWVKHPGKEQDAIIGLFYRNHFNFFTKRLLFFSFSYLSYLKKYAAVYRSIEGINAAVVGILIAATLYIMKDISIIQVKTVAL